ncbi:hypothetical protein BD410DRAFT_844993 [Rickenella mellea]|uniref:JmjC domain-containing protein n=1 Tax=Rickenella mellea TaxID=50990 RepID=A0A4Y7PJR9_9AGAM|nr:hypothetical protein BD410DRAFT_844993 [Rickenella mellea]
MPSTLQANNPSGSGNGIGAAQSGDGGVISVPSEALAASSNLQPQFNLPTASSSRITDERLSPSLSTDSEPSARNDGLVATPGPTSDTISVSLPIPIDQPSSFQRPTPLPLADLAKTCALFRNATFYSPAFITDAAPSDDFRNVLSYLSQKFDVVAKRAVVSTGSVESQCLEARLGSERSTTTHTPWNLAVFYRFLGDRLLWASESFQDGQPALTVTQIPHDALPAMDPQCAKHYEEIFNWPKNVNKFGLSVQRASSSHGFSASSDSLQAMGIVGGLYDASEGASKALDYYKAKRKLSLAALAMRAIAKAEQVAERTAQENESGKEGAEGKEGATESDDSKNPLVAYLREASEKTKAAMSGWTDAALCRTLFYAVSFSIFSLIDDTTISPPSSRRNISLAKLCEALVYPSLPNDVIRLTVEKDLWCLLMRMAIHGAQVFEENMPDLVESWKRLGLIVGPEGSRLPPAGLVLSPNQWNAQVNARSPPPEAENRGDAAAQVQDGAPGPSAPSTPPPAQSTGVALPAPVSSAPVSPPRELTPPQEPPKDLPPPASNFVQEENPQITAATFPNPTLASQDLIPPVKETYTSATATPAPSSNLTPPSESVLRSNSQTPPVPPTEKEGTPNAEGVVDVEMANATIRTVEHEDGVENPSTLGPLTRSRKRKEDQIDQEVSKSPGAVIGSAKPAKRRKKTSKHERKHPEESQILVESDLSKSTGDETVPDYLGLSAQQQVIRESYVFELPVVSVEEDDPGIIEVLLLPVQTPSADVDGNITWSEVTHGLEVIPGLETEFAECRRVRDKSHGGNSKEHKTNVATFSNKTWTGMTEKQQRHTFREQSIHVVADGTQQSAASEIRDWEDLGKLLDTEIPRQVHDHCFNDLFRPSSVEEDGPSADPNVQVRDLRRRLHQWPLSHLLDLMEEKRKRIENGKLAYQGKTVLNYLSLPVGQANAPGVLNLADGHQHTPLVYKEHKWHTELPVDCLAWALAATCRATSGTHIDAAGFCTWINVLFGIKLWYIATSYTLPGENGWSEDMDSWRWQVVVMRKGDVFAARPSRYMRPGTPHFVITVDDSFCIGGHFYNRENFDMTLHAMDLENWFGSNITNTDHVTAPIILFKIFSRYISLIPEHHRRLPSLIGQLPAEPAASPNKEDKYPLHPKLGDLVTAPQFSALLRIMQGIAADLEPEVLKDTVSWQDTPQFDHDYSQLSYQRASGRSAYILKSVRAREGVLKQPTLASAMPSGSVSEDVGVGAEQNLNFSPSSMCYSCEVNHYCPFCGIICVGALGLVKCPYNWRRLTGPPSTIGENWNNCRNTLSLANQGIIPSLETALEESSDHGAGGPVRCLENPSDPLSIYHHNLPEYPCLRHAMLVEAMDRQIAAEAAALAGGSSPGKSYHPIVPVVTGSSGEMWEGGREFQIYGRISLIGNTKTGIEFDAAIHRPWQDAYAPHLPNVASSPTLDRRYSLEARRFQRFRQCADDYNSESHEFGLMPFLTFVDRDGPPGVHKRHYIYDNKVYNTWLPISRHPEMVSRNLFAINRFSPIAMTRMEYALVLADHYKRTAGVVGDVDVEEFLPPVISWTNRFQDADSLNYALDWWDTPYSEGNEEGYDSDSAEGEEGYESDSVEGEEGYESDLVDDDDNH